MPTNLKDIIRIKYLSPALNLKEKINLEEILSEDLLAKIVKEPLISYNFKGGTASNEDGKFKANINNCVFHETVDDRKNVFEFNKSGSHINIPANNILSSISTISVSLSIKFEDNNQDRINLFENSSARLAFMMLRKNNKYYLSASVNLANGWHGITAENNPINPNEWHNLSAVFTGEEIFIFKETICIARRIFKNAQLNSIEPRDSFIGTWGDGKRNQFKGMLSSFKLWDDIPYYLNIAMGKVIALGMGEIESKYLDLGGENSFLGKKLGPEKEIVQLIKGKNEIIGRYCDFTGGSIYWSSSTGSYEVHGSILGRYKSLSNPSKLKDPIGRLGFPITDEINGKIKGSKISRFENGAIYWSGATGAHEINEHLYEKYVSLGGESGYFGLPIGSTKSLGTFNDGCYLNLDLERMICSEEYIDLQRGRLYYSSQSGAHEVHGDILSKYLSLDKDTRKYLGLPISDELDILDKNESPTGKKLSHFQSGTIYWSGSTGANEVYGAILKKYKDLGGPLGEMGLPISGELTAPNTNIRYNNFEKGIILWKPEWGARSFTNLELRLGQVVSDEIDDGHYYYGAKDRSAELFTQTTVIVNDKYLEKDIRRPKGFSGSSYNINKTYPILNIKHDTKLSFNVKAYDSDDDVWYKKHDDDYLGSIVKHFDISTLWGTDNEQNGHYNEQPLTHKGGDAPSLNSVKLSFSIVVPSFIDPKKCFREQCWWNFDNFEGLYPLKQVFYANTFKNVQVIGDNIVEQILNPIDTLIYKLAYQNITKKGNCFGMSLEALSAIKNNSLFTIPLDKYKAINDETEIKYHTQLKPYIYTPINRKQGYQISSNTVTWMMKKLLNSNALSPLATFSNVKKLINQGDRPIISMMSISKGKGHAVLAYTYSETEKISKIFVADPNVPYPRHTDINGNAGYIEIDKNKNTFKFYQAYENTHGNIIGYETGTMLAGLLPDTVMIEIPYHVVSSHPSTPSLTLLLGLVGILGGLMIILGDAESEQISSYKSNFYDYPNGQKRQRIGGIKGLAKIPIFDGPDESLELYSMEGKPPKSLEFKFNGVKNGHYAQVLGTYNNTLKIEAPIKLNEKDYIHIEGAHTSRPSVGIKTSGEAKNIRLSYETSKDIKKKENILYNIDFHASKGESIVGIDSLSGCLIISQAGPPKQILIEKVFMKDNVKTKLKLSLNPSIENEIIKIQELEFDNFKNKVLIEKTNPNTGKIIDRIKSQFI